MKIDVSNKNLFVNLTVVIMTSLLNCSWNWKNGPRGIPASPFNSVLILNNLYSVWVIRRNIILFPLSLGGKKSWHVIKSTTYLNLFITWSSWLSSAMCIWWEAEFFVCVAAAVWLHAVTPDNFTYTGTQTQSSKNSMHCMPLQKCSCTLTWIHEGTYSLFLVTNAHLLIDLYTRVNW